ncbi:hypothetical protein [Frigoribacterium sp. UYMn621]
MKTPPTRIHGLAAVLSLKDCDPPFACRGCEPMIIVAVSLAS